MANNLLGKIIVGGLIVGTSLGLTGCLQKEDKTTIKDFSNKGLIDKFSMNEGMDNIALAVGDMDGDGDLDVLIAKSNGNDRGVKYLENIGNGQYADRGLIYRFPMNEGRDNVAIAVGDMDGDGDLDVLIAKSNGKDRGVQYIENNIPQKNK
jgi:hypothetical protein